VNLVLSIVVIAGVFAVLFRYLPDARPAWNNVWQGALFTSILFSVGKLAIGLYLGKASVGDTYGAAGSLVVLLVWIYYSAQLVFFGAEFTQVYARHNGAPVRKNSEKRAAKEPQSTAQSDYRAQAGRTAPITNSRLPKEAAAGNARLSGVNEAGDHSVGVLGTLIGSALAVTKLLRGWRK
jgi:hypothetical protein